MDADHDQVDPAFRSAEFLQSKVLIFRRRSSIPSLRPSVVAFWLGWVVSHASVCPIEAAPQQVFDDTVEVIQVEVPVTVIRNGAPVRGLERDDFRITAAGKKREIVGFSVIDLAESQPADRNHDIELPLAARRHFMLLFDLAFSNPTAIIKARRAAVELVEKGLHPTDLVAVAAYSSASGLSVPLGFTADRGEILLAIASLGRPDVLRSYLEGSDQDLETLKADPVGDPRFDAELHRQLEAMMAETSNAAQGDLASRLLSSLDKLAEVFETVSGRKQLIYLSEGFAGSLVTGVGVATEGDRAKVQEMNEAVVSGESWKVGSSQRYGYVDQRNHLSDTLQRFVDVDSAIHTVDVGGIRTGDLLTREPRTPGQDTLFIMADKTGGEFLPNYNDLNVAMKEVLERASVTYLVSFRLTEKERDGQRHKIKVKLKQEGRGTRLLYRPSYVATDSAGD